MAENRAKLRTTVFVIVALACAACPPPKTSPNTVTNLTRGAQPAGLVITAPSVGGTLTLSTEDGLALPAGLTSQLTATETFADGTSQDVTATTQWTSGATATGTVSPGGLLTAQAVGNTTITASVGLFTQAFPLNVEPAITSIAIATDLSALWVGDIQDVQVIATLADGSMIDVTGQATWASGSATIATISPAGVVTGVAAGMTTITASVDTLSASAPATVLAAAPMLTSIAIGTDNSAPASLASELLPGLAQALGVWGTYSETSSPQNITSSTAWNWTSSNTAAATISTGGVITAVAAGATMITVSGLGQTASRTLTVTAPVQSIAIAGLPVSLGPDTYIFPDVIATLADGTSVDVSAWTSFTSSSRHIAALEGEALLGRNAGSATITATLGNATASGTVNVIAVSSLQIVPATLSVPVGLVNNWITVFATLADGSVIDATGTVTWKSSAPTIANFEMPGATEINTPLSGVAPGSATITATLGSASATAMVTVTPAVTVESLALTPASSTLHFDSSQTLTATATLTGGTTLDVTPFVSWGGAVATGGLAFTTDFGAGTLAGLSPAGANTVTVQLGSQMASATLNVSTATISSIAVLPQSISLTAGQTQPMTVTATYSDGMTADVTSLAVWSSTDSDGTIAVIDQSSTSRATVVAEGTGMATLTAWITPSGPYVGGALETLGSTTVTVQ